MYCHKRASEKEECGFWFNDIFGHPKSTQVCDGTLLIFKIRVRELKEGETSTYWGWWDNKENKFTLVHITRGILSMCFPYELKWYVEKGSGQDYNVMLEILEEINPKDVK